jgi:WhiB family transcriptional regulator, redox-sensing transcriptional regulator
VRDPGLYEDPACASVGGDFWFPEKESNTRDIALAKSICNGCLHRTECAEWGIRKEHFGIWGGLGERERSRIRREKNIHLRGSEVA